MERSHFEELVRFVLEGIPDELKVYVDNVDIVVEDCPRLEQLAGHVINEGDYLLGLYEGVPLTERSDYSMVLPDKITFFQKSIESICDGEEEIIDEVRRTLIHELAHHFGIEDKRLAELED